VAARYKEWVCGRSLAGIAGSNAAAAWMSVSCECCVLSGRGLCDGPFPRPEEEFYRVWCVWVCVSLSVISCNNNTLHAQWVGRRGQTKKERKKECAFDLVSHTATLLLRKLGSFILTNVSVGWFHLCLLKMSFTFLVILLCSFTDFSVIPHGSVLGFLLFNIFNYDSLSVIDHLKYFLFLDDINISC
jgi:hypothetical protein